MNGIRYGVGNLDVWEQFGFGIGFAAGGFTILACLECGEQRMVEPGNPVLGRAVLSDMIVHINSCPPRKKPAPPQGPIAVAIVEKGVYKAFVDPESSELDCAL